MQKIELEVDYDSLTNLVRAELVSALNIIEEQAEPQDIELWMAMIKVIEYYSSPQQFKEFDERGVHKNWEELVFETIRDNR